MKKVVQTGKYISVLYRMLLKYMTENISCHGVSNSEYFYLLILQDLKEATQEELTKHAIVDKAQTTRAIKSLIDKELVVKKPNPSDGRSFLISLSREGKIIAPKIKEEIMGMERVLNNGLTNEQQRTMKKHLIQMIKNMK